MCDELDGRGCEVVDELETTISDLEEDIEVLEGAYKLIEELQSERDEKDLEIQELKDKIASIKDYGRGMILAAYRRVE